MRELFKPIDKRAAFHWKYPTLGKSRMPITPMKSRLLPVAALWLVALAMGFGAKRLFQPEPTENAPGVSDKHASRPAEEAAPSDGTEAERIKELFKAAAATKSDDTLESILQIDPVAEYGRLALWMVDASAEDIGAYWQHYRQRESRSNDINDLIFINWTRLDPEAAVTASSGTDDEHYAWWAWACHDPEKALAEVLVRDPERLNNVTWALGEFHAEWVMKHFDEIPEEGRDNVFFGMVKWDDAEDPGMILDFLKENGRGLETGLFKTLVRKDPWAAYERVTQLNGRENQYWGGENPMDVMIKSMAEFHPDLLERMAQMTTSGELKRRMESMAYDSLLSKDPEEAYRQALDERAPVIAADRLAKAGNALLAVDPDRAFGMAEAFFQLTPDAITGRVVVERENGWGSRGSGGPGDGFLSGLVANDASRTMELAVSEVSEGQGRTDIVRTVSNLWAAQDLEGFAEGLAVMEPSDSRSVAVGVLVNQLAENGYQADAVQWCASDENMRGQLWGYFRAWHDVDPEAAAGWLSEADLSAEQRARLETSMENR